MFYRDPIFGDDKLIVHSNTIKYRLDIALHSWTNNSVLLSDVDS